MLKPLAAVLLALLFLPLAACKPAAVPPPVSAEVAALVGDRENDAVVFHRFARGVFGLPADPQGETVVQLATYPTGGEPTYASALSVTATRTWRGWRIERITVSRSSMIVAPPPYREVIPVSAADGARLDRLLSSRSFYVQPIYQPHAACLGDQGTVLFVRSAWGRWRGVQPCTADGPAGELIGLLTSLPPVKSSAVPAPPPVSAETAALVSKLDSNALIMHRELRAAVGLPAEPRGEAVVRFAGWALMSQIRQSLTAIRTQDGWRIELIGVRDLGVAGAKPKPELAVIPVSVADGARIDALLTAPAFYGQPVYQPHPGCMDGQTSVLAVATPTGRWTGAQMCMTDGPAGDLMNLLFGLVPPASL